MKSGSTFNEALVNDPYSRMDDPENPTRADSTEMGAKSWTRRVFLLKVFFAVLVVALLVGLIVHLSVGKKSDEASVDDHLISVDHVYAAVSANDGSTSFKLGKFDVCDWEVVAYDSYQDVDIVDDAGRDLHEPANYNGDIPENWNVRDDWYVHWDEKEQVVYGKLCDNYDSTVSLVVEPGVEVRGHIENGSEMIRVDFVDHKTSKLVIVEAEDLQGLPWTKPSQDMLDWEKEWAEHTQNITNNPIQPMPASQTRDRSGRKEIWIDYVIGYEMVQRRGANSASQYISQLNAMINRIYYHKINFNLIVRKVTIRRSHLVRSTNNCATLLTALQHANPKAANIHLVHYVTSQDCGGGVAFGSGLYNARAAFAVSGSLNMDFGRWDEVVVAHEFGHNFGAWHTHELRPPADNCGNNCRGGRQEYGTVMSYCHGCGGWNYMRQDWHPRIVQQIQAEFQKNGHFLL